jgi:hypothetical protein
MGRILLLDTEGGLALQQQTETEAIFDLKWSFRARPRVRVFTLVLTGTVRCWVSSMQTAVRR